MDTSDQKVANSQFDWAVGCCCCGCDSCGSLPPTFDCDREMRCFIVTLSDNVAQEAKACTNSKAGSRCNAEGSVPFLRSAGSRQPGGFCIF